MQVVGVRVTSYDKKFTHFNYFGASCRYAGEWTVLHLSVHICFLASTFFTNIPARSQTSSHGHFTHQVLTLSQLQCTRVPIMSTATAINAKVSFDPQPTKETFFLLCPLREITAKQQKVQ